MNILTLSYLTAVQTRYGLSHGYLQSLFSYLVDLRLKTSCEAYINNSTSYSGYLSNVDLFIQSVTNIIDSVSLGLLQDSLEL